ncbi:helix-turn-helix domain-containing protein [Acidimicrobiaceae bacterium USS-CC1]|uniref:Helix-turn-helix domain-containing protein n=1 Tax=Acidiferrimicrobium australe TaxID=2664430 RepID=A0ABW9QZU8_9ACTN|nr:helix-turn-helix domain-containing protein [Acidiferrimicrobium australe]
MASTPQRSVEELAARLERRQLLPPPAKRRLIRRRAGASQQDIAAAVGVHRETVSRWERGERSPRGVHVDAYLAVLTRLEEFA